VLVEGNHPRVCEEGRDLVIFEDVLVPAIIAESSEQQQHQATTTAARSPSTPNRPPGVPSRGRTFSGQLPAASPATPAPVPPKSPSPMLPIQRPTAVVQTPKRKPGRPSLHRAVLIRSAQRAVQRWEEQEDEMEVDESLVRGPLEMSTSSSEGGEESASGDEASLDVEMDLADGDEDVDEDHDTTLGAVDVPVDAVEHEEQEMEVDLGDCAGPDAVEEHLDGEEAIKDDEASQERKKGWRKSLEAVKEGLGWVIRGRSKSRERDEADTSMKDVGVAILTLDKLFYGFAGCHERR
jgi:hypothetical protein